MNLKILSNLNLENQFNDLVSKERKLLHLILLHIREIDIRRLYLERACPSLFDYLTKQIGYSPSAAQRRIEASRLLKDIPVLAEKIQTGSVNLTQVGELVRAIKQKERESDQRITCDIKKDLLNKIENMNSFETQKVLAKALDLDLKPTEHKRIQKDESVHLQITLTKDQYVKLLKCKDLSAHKLLQNKQGTGLAEVIEILSDQFLVKKCEAPATKLPNILTTVAVVRGEVKVANRTLTSKTKKIVLSKQNCCQFKDPTTGEQCMSTFALEIDHKTSKWAGGNHEIGNLQVLCSGHNKYKYHKEAQIRLV